MVTEVGAESSVVGFRREIRELKAQLQEATQTLDAIRAGEVDAVLAGGFGQEQVYTLHSADRPYRLLIEEMQEGAVTLTAAGLILYCNHALATMLGIPQEQLVGSLFGRFVDAVDQARFATMLPAEGRGEIGLRRGDGAAFQAQLSLANLADSDERVICAVITDLTEVHQQAHAVAEARARHDAERLAREAEARHRHELERLVEERTRERDRIWQISADLFVIWDGEGRNHNVNPAWTKALGYLREELIGARVTDFLHPEDVDMCKAALARLLAGGTTRGTDTRFRTKDGAYRTYSWTGSLEGTLYYATGRDVTDQRALEAQLRQSQKMEAVGQLTGGLAHDFNNLLAGITGSLELMQSRVRQGRIGELDRYMSIAQGAAKRAAGLTHRLLAFSRRQTLDPKPTDVDRLVSGMLEMIRRTVGPAIKVETAGSGDLWPALVDAPQLENALLNLCINARDAMPDGGGIVIETARRQLDEVSARTLELPAGEYLALSVTDTGTGMPPEVIARVFEPFFTTKPTGEGTGLGLSMIYGFARQSGGQVRIDSEVGMGTTVCIYLPRHHGAATVEAATPQAGALQRSGSSATVLIVDDEPSVRMLLADILDELGYTAIEAGDSKAGLDILQSDLPLDLLVTDVGLPGGMNGRQMVDAARSHRPDLKVLFITGYAESAVFSNGYFTSGMAVLTKPFSIDAMAARIRSLIEAG